MSACHLCRSSPVEVLLDFERQPICNRLLSDPTEDEYTHTLVMGQCEACGLVQLINTPAPPGELRPRYEWMIYREPETHLDELAERLMQLPGITKDSTVCGISFKDDSLLERMRRLGVARTWRMELGRDLGIAGRGAGVEMIQDRLDDARSAEAARRHGRPDVVIARHILEHAHDLQKFTAALKTLVSPTGYIVLEAPDCTKALETFDYTTLWEEHILYFTPETFVRYHALHGFSLLAFSVFPYAVENSLVGVARVAAAPRRASEDVLRRERARAKAFAEQFHGQRERLRRWLADYRRTTGKVALFGAGHLGCAFINFLGLQEHIEFIVDDHPQKQGLFMPGSRLPIRGSDALLRGEIRLCLLGLNPDSEERVIERHRPFLEQGGSFASIFSASKYALSV